MDIEQFYISNYRIVFGYLFSLCRDQHMAEDLTSETFLRAIQKIDAYDGRVKASTWLCTIAKNLYRNEVKRQGFQANLEYILLADKDSPEDAVLRKERVRLLVKLIDELEEPKDQLFLLRQQGMSFREIGEALGKTENWARVTYFRIKESILQRMEEMK